MRTKPDKEKGKTLKQLLLDFKVVKESDYELKRLSYANNLSKFRKSELEIEKSNLEYSIDNYRNYNAILALLITFSILSIPLWFLVFGWQKESAFIVVIIVYIIIFISVKTLIIIDRQLARLHILKIAIAIQSNIYLSRLTAIQSHKLEILNLAAQYGVSNIRVFSLTEDEGGRKNNEFDFLVDLQPGRTLLDLSGFMMDLRDLLSFEVFVFTKNSLKDAYRDLILQKAIEL